MKVKVTGPVYAKYDKTSDVQDESVSANRRENIIEDSVISDGDRDMEEAKYDIYKKNSKKIEGCDEVEVNYNGEDNLNEATTN